MSERIHGLAQLLPGKSSLEECSLEELQHITKRYPFFAPAQFLLLQKLKETDRSAYHALLQKVVLYYPDPLQFEAFIAAEKFYIDESDRLLSEKEEKQSRVLHSAGVVHQPQESQKENDSLEPDTSNEAGIEDNLTIDRLYMPSATEAENVNEDHHLLPEQQPQDHSPILIEPDKVERQDEIESAEPGKLPVSPLQETAIPVNEEAVQEKHSADHAMVMATDDEAIVVAPILAIRPREQTDESFSKEQAQLENNRLNTLQATAGETVVDKAAGEPLAFEPYHTVDYFASQGIKVSQEDLSKDKLSRQLRSFTEWLKVMKRLPAADMAQKPESTAEKTVETLASHSVEGSEVVTEAMAEVWAKQGNTAKAIETYNKLSLLNPSKKAYFASKIENLSGT